MGLTLSDCQRIVTITWNYCSRIVLVKGLIEYVYQGKQKRVEHSFNIRKKLKENDAFKEICLLLDNSSVELRNISFTIKRDFLGLFEEIAIMKMSGIRILSRCLYVKIF